MSHLLIQPGSKLLFTGDSVTDTGRRNSDLGLGGGYVQMIADLLLARHPEHRFPIRNTGIAGNNLRDLFDRWSDDVIRHQPDWLNVMIGINDVNFWLSKMEGRSVSPDEFADLYDKILSRTRNETKAQIVLIPPFYISTDLHSDSYRSRVLNALPAYQNIVRQMADKYQCHLVDFHAMFQRQLVDWPMDRFAPEPVHPAASGHLLMACEWLRTMKF